MLRRASCPSSVGGYSSSRDSGVLGPATTRMSLFCWPLAASRLQPAVSTAIRQMIFIRCILIDVVLLCPAFRSTRTQPSSDDYPSDVITRGRFYRVELLPVQRAKHMIKRHTKVILYTVYRCGLSPNRANNES